MHYHYAVAQRDVKMNDRVGQQFGDYRLTRWLGRGSFGDVYLGEHIHDRTLAAVKVLQTQLTNSKDLKEFINEARTFRLKHPHIVQLLDFGVGASDIPFIVMEYASNGTLRQRHPRGTQLPLATVVTYVQQVSDALQYAHDRRLIHRDIKPENMLLGPKDEVWLSDFGIAVVAYSTHSLQTQNMGGTVPYMAPEQNEGKPRPASDQYALGIVVYEWLCGNRPFNGTAIEIAVQHALNPPPSLCEQVATISPEVEKVVLRALTKDPQQRFDNVRAFAEALQAATTPQPKAPPVPQKTKEQWLKEGDAHYDAERYEEAIAAYDRALELDPTYSTYNKRGSAYSKFQQYVRAIKDFTRALELHPTYAEAYNNRGVAYECLQQNQRAIEDFDRSLDLDPTYTKTYINRGLAYYYLQQYERAIVDYDHAIELDPAYALAYTTRGLAYYALQQNQRAIEDFGRSLDLDPNNASAKKWRDEVARPLKKSKRWFNLW
jgi:serine/threonine protein kinase